MAEDTHQVGWSVNPSQTITWLRQHGRNPVLLPGIAPQDYGMTSTSGVVWREPNGTVRLAVVGDTIVATEGDVRIQT